MGRQDKAPARFPEEQGYKFTITCNFPIHWGWQGSRKRADGTWPAATL